MAWQDVPNQPPERLQERPTFSDTIDQFAWRLWNILQHVQGSKTKAEILKNDPNLTDDLVQKALVWDIIKLQKIEENINYYRLKAVVW